MYKGLRSPIALKFRSLGFSVEEFMLGIRHHVLLLICSGYKGSN